MHEFVNGETDTETVVRIVNEVVPWGKQTVDTIEHARKHLKSFRDWIVLLDGEPAGVGATGELPDLEGTEVLWVNVSVVRQARRRGVGSAIHDRVSAHGRSLGKTTLETLVWEDDPDGLAYAERRGYRCVSRARGLRLVLAGLPAPEVPVPDGIAITTLAERRDLAHGVWKLASETMPEIPIDTDEPFHPGTFEQFTELSLNSPHSIPEATFVALHGDEPVGYGRLTWLDEEAGIGYHQMLGVTRAFRGRGIASVLKGKQIAWAIDHGLTELRTQNEVRNAPVRALNGHYPYEPMPDMLVMRGPLAQRSPARGRHVLTSLLD